MAGADRTVWFMSGLGALGIVGALAWYWVGNARQSQFAADRAANEKPVMFDAKRAQGYLQKICDLGPRISGTPEMEKQQVLLKKHFEEHGATVELQRFPARQRSQPKAIEMANLIARWHPDRPRRILIGAHYDTRPIADQEPERKWRDKFLAANDGASGPALMMELAHHLAKLPTEIGVDFVLFDGEEWIFDPRPQELGGDKYFFGSEHFAVTYRKARRENPKGPVYVEAVVVDMIAGTNAKFFYEGYSWNRAGPLTERIWKLAAEVGAKRFVADVRHTVQDDHLALLAAGIPTTDIIDFDYPHWHRLTDVPGNCSGETMAEVAKVLTVWMQRAK